MNGAIEKLLVLQERDRQILQREREINELPDRIKALEGRAKARREALQQAQDAQKKQQLRIKELENEIEEHRQKINKYRSQQLEVRTNDEYRALDHEVLGVQEKIRGLEDDELAAMELLDVAQKTVAVCEKDFQAEQKLVEAGVQDLRRNSALAAEGLAQLKQERAGFAAQLDGAMLGRYDRVLARHGEDAVVHIVHAACGGCHMKLPPAVIQEARKGDQAVLCNFCQRLLVEV